MHRDPDRPNRNRCAHRKNFTVEITGQMPPQLVPYLPQYQVDGLGLFRRCLRCGVLSTDAPSYTGPADGIPEIARGRSITQEFWLRVFAIERGVRAILLFFVAWVIWRFRQDQLSLQRIFGHDWPVISSAARQLHFNLDSSTIVEHLRHGLFISPHKLNLAIALVLAYAVIEIAEAVGLWLQQRWGEYLAVVITFVFIPFEVMELAHHPSVFKGLALGFNVALFLYILLAKRLFWLRGGGKALMAMERAESLIPRLAPLPA